MASSVLPMFTAIEMLAAVSKAVSSHMPDEAEAPCLTATVRFVALSEFRVMTTEPSRGSGRELAAILTYNFDSVNPRTGAGTISIQVSETVAV